jgi:ribosome-associated translation inhibitor RaiA
VFKWQVPFTENEKGSLMNTPVEIHFHGIEKSEAIEKRVREKVSKLERHFGRITRCRVVLEAPHRTPAKAKVYQIKIEIGMPRQQAVVISHEREGSHANEELPLAIRDAFEAAVRKIDGVASKLGERARLERGRRRPRANGAEG